MEISARLKSIPPYVFAEIDKKRQAAVARGVDVINLGIGDPDQPTFKHIVEAAKAALDNPLNHRYPPFGGMKEYKEAAAKWCQNRFGIVLDPESEITSLIGSKEGIHNILAAFVDAGDVALIPDPAYPVYKSSTIMAGGTPYAMPLLAENDFLADLDAIPADIAKKAKIMFLNYPNNPTAAVCDLAYLEKAVAFARKHDILLVHDLAYSEMTFDGYKAHSVLEVEGAKEVAIELHSLSKTFNMTGWRVGFAAGNSYAVKALAQLKSNIDTDIFRVVQVAAIAAFNGPRDGIDHCNKIYMERRDIAVNAFKKLGWPIRPLKATFYMWLPVPKGMTSADFSGIMLDEAGIVVPPGTAYGDCGEGFFRMSLCTDKARLQEAFDRMEKHSITFERNKLKV
ncbi:MAG: LL-diaminopimelate aminotransferase [Candidatus Obscuribacterales bacterium]|nr:LL-diaminopimelate aminotransferase [Candidatus Obscuribacterales bacterium]